MLPWCGPAALRTGSISTLAVSGGREVPLATASGEWTLRRTFSLVLAQPAARAGRGRRLYVAPETQGQGIGRALLTAIVASAEQAGSWTVQTASSPRTSPASA
jgi:GNAT superfamily N-acetyltransferase